MSSSKALVPNSETTQPLTEAQVQNAMERARLLEQVMIKGDLAKLTEGDRVKYYGLVCESIGLNPLTKPFDYITLNGKLTLYAKKDATDQLRKRYGISIKITDKKDLNGVYVVTAEAKDVTGREDSSTGAVSIGGLKGDMLANALMKAETKAKRRVTLSICGLGLLDETEVETIPQNPVYAEQPEVGDGNLNADVGYRIPFGKFAKRSLEEVPMDQLRSYVLFLENKAEQSGEPLSKNAQEFVERAANFIAAFENSSPVEEEEGFDQFKD